MSCADINCDDMVQGQGYTFHFKYGGWLAGAVSPDGLQSAVAADSNFASPTVVINCSGSLFKANRVSISFVYAGQGSTVANAGAEMQNVISNFWVAGIGTSLIFDGAETGNHLNCCCFNCSTGFSSLFWIAGLALAAYIAVQYIGFEKLKEALRR